MKSNLGFPLPPEEQPDPRIQQMAEMVTSAEALSARQNSKYNGSEDFNESRRSYGSSDDRHQKSHRSRKPRRSPSYSALVQQLRLFI